MKLPGGAGSITFEKDIKEWAGFQVVQEPGGGWALGGALTAIGGLAASCSCSGAACGCARCAATTA